MKYTVLENFTGSAVNPLGAGRSGLTFSSSGYAYGTNPTGGANGAGFAWSISPGGILTDIHDFGGTLKYANGAKGPDGANPMAGVGFDGKGNMYGATGNGGAYASGAVWEITNKGVYEDIHDFGGTISGVSDGIEPLSGVTVDGSGDLFGTTSLGGAHNNNPAGSGILWEITSSGSYHDLHDFGGTVAGALDGCYVTGGVTINSSGALFGTATLGGASSNGKSNFGWGVVWTYSGGVYTVLHNFGIGSDGAGPNGGVTFDSKGDMFGTTFLGGIYPYGNDPGAGTLWEIPKVGSYKTIHSFGGKVTNANGTIGWDGELPDASVGIDANGDIYGTTDVGGPFSSATYPGGGNIWEITSTGAYVDLHDFGGNATELNGTVGADGRWAHCPVTVDSSGNLYGTTEAGGINGGSSSSHNGGIVWELSDVDVSSVTFTPSGVIGGEDATGTITLTGAAPIGGFLVMTGSGNGKVKVPTSVQILAGFSSGSFLATTEAAEANYTSTVTAKGYAYTKSCLLTVYGDMICGFTLNPSSVVGGNSVQATVTLCTPAPPGGWLVHVSHASSQVVCPATIAVPAGATSATFTVTTASTNENYKATLSVEDTLTTMSAVLSVYADGISSLTVSPSTVAGTQNATGTVTLLKAAPSGGWVVNLTSSVLAWAWPPQTVTVSAGSTTAKFTIQTGATLTTHSVTITASDQSTQKSATLTITKGGHVPPPP